MKTVRKFTTIERNDLLTKSKTCLWTGQGLPGREYLLSQRKISETSIKDFELGYIPENVKHQLAGRIIFPIYDPSGNLVALSSRLVTGSSPLPVYWHEAYDKRFYLYGMNLAKQYILKWQFAILCEGQFDAIRMYDGGMKNTVALCGTSFSDFQFALIRRYCEELLFILDTDKNRSGQRAGEKVFKNFTKAAAGSPLYPKEFMSKISVLLFEENLDPDEYIAKYGMEHLKIRIKQKIQEMRKP